MTCTTQAADQAHQSLLDLEAQALDDADRRFYASYLLGHLSLISTETGEDGEALSKRLEQALDEAFAVDRLSDQDKLGIRSLWHEISADIGRGL
ncbi:YfcL family protein [Marinobacterium sp. D7]|uniref:YfcL family protein n=1 Tax=Marinobacterium ramblicola TaxID=2849041 RepID=UPI001C2D3B6C|nr:YfcL family protein [Marinobacterium ramblicola]MBV1787556.1 YfcL family protein [Marinobacterium ramblicola]